MSTLNFETFSMPSANLGKHNPLPDIQQSADLHATIAIDEETVTAEEARYMGWGKVNGILPYLIQNGYDRQKKPRAWKAAVLENDYIRALFLPELGGRLWSLIDKTTGRELLHRNPVFQPCNLALRNAWISGGVEWNIGIIGHSPFTVDNVFAESLELADGTPVLRLYQYERVRRLVYRVEAVLPETSRHVYIRVRIDNTSSQDTAVYWWSNIAVDERDDVRVIVPASQSFRYGYGGKLAKIPVPNMTIDPKQLSNWQAEQASHPARDQSRTVQQQKGVSRQAFDQKTSDRQPQKPDEPYEIDISRTTQIPQAMDFFFDLPLDQTRWIAAVGGDGYGLAQTSTSRLRGRKLFVWGNGAGGRNWQSFLARPGCAYLEIQAGLARTQLEHLPMRGCESISWVEAYGPVKADAASVHGQDWQQAVNAVEDALAIARPVQDAEQMYRQLEKEIDGKTGEIMHAAEGWGAVQKALLGKDFHDAGLRFAPGEPGRAEQNWLQLVHHLTLVCPDPLEEPDSYQVGPEWEDLLSHAITAGGAKHWYGYYQYGVTLAHAGKQEQADDAFLRSLNCAENPWALRCMAVLAQIKGNVQLAADLMLKAIGLLPEANLARETLAALQAAKRSNDVIAVYDALPSSIQEMGRMKVLLVEALLDCGEISRADEILKGEFELSDVREGEVMLTDLWFRLCAMHRGGTGLPDDDLLAVVKQECPPPAHLDFRMQ